MPPLPPPTRTPPAPYTTYAGCTLDGHGIINGLAFPIEIWNRTINGPIAWRLYLKDQDTLFAEWTTFRAERDLIAAHIRGEIPYKDIRHLVEVTT